MSKPDRSILNWRPSISPATVSLVAAVGAGIVAVLLVHGYIQRMQLSMGSEVEILVASRSLPAGTVIKDADLTTRRVHERWLHEQVVLGGSRYEVVGRMPAVEIAASQPIHWNTLKRDLVPRGMAMTLPEGQRAITVSVDRVAGVGGFVVPGDHVDIVATFVVPPGFAIVEGGKVVPRASKRENTGYIAQKLTKVVMQDVTVLAAGPFALDAALGGATAAVERGQVGDLTLMVTPVEGEILTFAEETGALRFMLRNKEADSAMDMQIEPVDVTSVLEVEKRATRQRAQTDIILFDEMEKGGQ